MGAAEVRQAAKAPPRALPECGRTLELAEFRGLWTGNSAQLPPLGESGAASPVPGYGPQASAENHRLVDGRTVRLVFDRERRDVYGRLLAYVYTPARGGSKRPRFVNAILVRDGYARTLTIAPNTSHVSELGHLETLAGRAGRGLWRGCWGR